MVLVSSYGAIWKMSNYSYQKLLKDIAAGKEYDFNDYGIWLGGQAVNLTDVTPELARDLLNEFKKKQEGK